MNKRRRYKAKAKRALRKQRIDRDNALFGPMTPDERDEFIDTILQAMQDGEAGADLQWSLEANGRMALRETTRIGPVS